MVYICLLIFVLLKVFHSLDAVSYVDVILQVCRGTQKTDKRWIRPSIYYPRGRAIILTVIRRLLSVKSRV